MTATPSLPTGAREIDRLTQEVLHGHPANRVKDVFGMSDVTIGALRAALLAVPMTATPSLPTGAREALATLMREAESFANLAMGGRTMLREDAPRSLRNAIATMRAALLSSSAETRTAGSRDAREQFFAAICAELDHAYAKHGRDPWGRHEFFAILNEEVDELWDEVRGDGSTADFLKEAVQVAAMCFRYAETGDRYRGAHSAIPQREQPINA